MSGHPTGIEQPFEPSLDVSRGRIGMWLFIATEVMFFTALLAAYVVLRHGAPEWPAGSSMHVDWLIGAVNTIVLISSGLCVSTSVRKLASGERHAARAWLTLALLLAVLFVGLKAFEYRDKYQHNLVPINREWPVFEQADAYYLAAVRSRVQALQADLRDDGESGVAQERLDWLNQFEQEQLLPAEQGLSHVPVKPAARAKCDALAAAVYTPTADEDAGGLNASRHWLRLPVVVPGGRLWMSTYFLLTGAHLLHLAFAILVAGWWVIVGLRPTTLPALSNLSLYWQFVDVVWLVLFGLIYFT